MEIITKIPTYSDGEVNRALMREIRTGVKLKTKLEETRVRGVRRYVQTARENKRNPVLGSHAFSMPAYEFFRLQDKYGHEEVHSEEFLKFHQKKFPDLTVEKL
jgi:hypothetical protein